MTGRFEPFACPVCGGVRQLSPRVARQVALGAASGECPVGVGCRAAVTLDEQRRRWWLKRVGVAEVEIRACLGAAGYVQTHGLPDELAAMASALPPVGAVVELVDRPGSRPKLPRGRHAAAAA